MNLTPGQSNKNDYIDAEALAEALQRPTMRFVPIKAEDQLDLQALHRVRDRLVAKRTGLIQVLQPLRQTVGESKTPCWIVRGITGVLHSTPEATSGRNIWNKSVPTSESRWFLELKKYFGFSGQYRAMIHGSRGIFGMHGNV